VILSILENSIVIYLQNSNLIAQIGIIAPLPLSLHRNPLPPRQVIPNLIPFSPAVCVMAAGLAQKGVPMWQLTCSINAAAMKTNIKIACKRHHHHFSTNTDSNLTTKNHRRSSHHNSRLKPCVAMFHDGNSVGVFLEMLRYITLTKFLETPIDLINANQIYFMMNPVIPI
jgi:hypothetical protein